MPEKFFSRFGYRPVKAEEMHDGFILILVCILFAFTLKRKYTCTIF